MHSKPSPAIEILNLIWNNANSEVSHSWERLNTAMRDALQLAIGSGFPFEIGDFDYIRNNYDSNRWIGDWEWAYREAVSVDNKSAYQSFEACFQRTAIIADHVDIPASRFLHLTSKRSRGRLVVGARFIYQGRLVTVTSFADDNSYLTACTYKDNGAYPLKIAKRFKITRESIIADRAERKEREELINQLTAANSNDPGKVRKELKEMGIVFRKDLDTLPIKNLRMIVGKFATAHP